MTKTSSQEVLAIAQKFNLFEGKDQDFYLLHGRNVALTKMGAQKVTDALGIEFTNPVSTVGPNFIAFQAEFSDREGNKIHEVGSCRWDLAKPPSPEATHAAEMAWKRMVVRGVIKLAAPGVFSGEDEFTQDFRQYGPGGAPQAPPQQGYQQPPQAPPYQPGPPQAAPATAAPPQAAPPQTAPNGAAAYGAANVDPGANHPNAGAARASEGWAAWADKLPAEWGDLMGQISEVTRVPRAAFERQCLNWGAAFQKDDGTTWFPYQSGINTFSDMVYRTYQNTWKGKQSLRVKKKIAEEVFDKLSQGYAVSLPVLEVDGTRSVVDLNPASARSTKASQPTNAGQAAPDFPSPSDFDGGQQPHGGPMHPNEISDDVPF